MNLPKIKLLTILLGSRTINLSKRMQKRMQFEVFSVIQIIHQM